MASVERDHRITRTAEFKFRSGGGPQPASRHWNTSSSRSPWLSTLALASFVLAAPASTVPRINWIQLPAFLPGTILLHFDTDPNRTYEIQYVDYAPTNGTTWSILATIPAQPSPNHFVWTDFLVPGTTQRFYRLKATP